MDKLEKYIGAVWVADIVLALGFWGVVIWAIVRLVQYFT